MIEQLLELNHEIRVFLRILAGSNRIALDTFHISANNTSVPNEKERLWNLLLEIFECKKNH